MAIQIQRAIQGATQRHLNGQFCGSRKYLSSHDLQVVEQEQEAPHPPKRFFGNRDPRAKARGNSNSKGNSKAIQNQLNGQFCGSRKYLSSHDLQVVEQEQEAPPKKIFWQSGSIQIQRAIQRAIQNQLNGQFCGSRKYLSGAGSAPSPKKIFGQSGSTS